MDSARNLNAMADWKKLSEGVGQKVTDPNQSLIILHSIIRCEYKITHYPYPTSVSLIFDTLLCHLF
jgi:hypothetical protein